MYQYYQKYLAGKKSLAVKYHYLCNVFNSKLQQKCTQINIEIMKHLLLTFTLIAFGLFLSAQEIEVDNNAPEPEIKTEIFKNEFGAHAGFTTGIGLAYRRWIGNFGGQITFLPVKGRYIEFYSGGLSFLYSMIRNRYINVYGYAGSHMIYMDQEKHYNFGIGPGFSFGRVVTFNIQVGYGLYFDEVDYMMLPTAEMGLYFRF